MEITSYLLGKKSSGGSSGSTGLDWKALGYDPAPVDVVDDYNYSKTIQENWDTSQTDLSNKFSGDTDLKHLPSLDAKSATTMYRMFYTCGNLISVATLESSNLLTSTAEMFRECKALIDIDLSHFDTSSVTTMGQMFRNCQKFKELDLSNFVTTSTTNMGGMFQQCLLLQKLDIRNFDFTNVTSYSGMFTGVPADCLIIVHDQTAKDWVLDKRSDFTNVKTVAEYNAMQ